MRAIRGEGGIVHDEDGMRIRKCFRHVSTMTIPQLLLIPAARIDEVPQGLHGITDLEVRREGNQLNQGFDALPFAIREQCPEILQPRSIA